MITINHPSVQTEGNAVTISYPILQDGHAPRTLSFTVDSRFRDFLNPGRADGALVALLPWISQQGGQVRVLPAISAHLYHFGIRLLSHILTGIGPFLKPVELAGEVHAEVLSPIPGCRMVRAGPWGWIPCALSRSWKRRGRLSPTCSTITAAPIGETGNCLKADESSAGILLKKTVWNSSGWIHPCTIFMATRDI